MSSRIERPDVNIILNGLKPFQRDTVEYVFERLYLDENSSRRFLVADEVGLGKTLVARGVIAKTIDYLWDKTDLRIDIVYICSNADIARQNIKRLNVTGRRDFEHASRITLLPVILHNMDSKLNFVSFTPGTSFELRSSLGIMKERILLYWLLKDGWNLKGTKPLNVLQGGVASHESWRSQVLNNEQAKNFDDKVVNSFLEDLDQHITAEKKAGKTNIRSRFEDLCERFGYPRKYQNIPQQDNHDRSQVVGELRSILAKTCLRLLEPDLVILDEFQRFKHLLSGDSEASLLARELFEYSDSKTDVRTLLLSATPYKMYTMYDEKEEDDHYQDFLNTLTFLENDKDCIKTNENLIQKYRREFYRLGNGNESKILEFKGALENSLRRTIVRTERVDSSIGNDGMLEEIPQSSLSLSHRDALTYLSLQSIARHLGQGDTVEYWKSSPYLLNFMDYYKFKELFRCEILSDNCLPLRRILSRNPHLLLSWEDIKAYKQVDPCNARLRHLLDDTLQNDAWRLLWMPPTLSYYAPGGPYEKIDARRLTKRLVFSAWAVVPKVISSLLSYEAERLMFRSFENDPENSPEARKKRAPLLRFASSSGRLTGMPVLGMLYPSFVLARCGDPLEFYMAGNTESGNQLTVEEITRKVAERFNKLLGDLPINEDPYGREDESWYWAAPILLDMHENSKKTREWLEQSNLNQIWSGETEDLDEDGGESRFIDHIDHAREVLMGRLELGRQPEDLPTVMAQMAIGGPAIAALRSLCRISGGLNNCDQLELRNQAAKVAWGFRKLFNQPQVIALLRGMNAKEPYWRRVTEYCVDGGLQPVLDEYVHILKEFLGFSEDSSNEAVSEISDVVNKVLSMMTSRTVVDDIFLDKDSADINILPQSFRGHFALRFGAQKSDSNDESTREDQVRVAFNSPFWPFVLASTSVGQEGLDFHPYCHAVVHWNLPPNPVDMEQREGRIHRYKGHAVRKNIAETYGAFLVGENIHDPWLKLFEMGDQDHSTKSRGLMPYWIYSIPGGAKIERHVPALPLSRDWQKLNALRKSLVVYRMVFGQARQEDLVEYLLAHLPDDQVVRLSKDLQINLAPPRYNLNPDGCD